MYLDKAVLWKKGAAFLFPFQNMMKAEQKVLKVSSHPSGVLHSW